MRISFPTPTFDTVDMYDTQSIRGVWRADHLERRVLAAVHSALMVIISAVVCLFV